MMITSEQYNKLPKWARDHVDDLQREIGDLRRSLSHLEKERSGEDSDKARMTWDYLMEGEHPLPEYTRVRVYFNRKRESYIGFRWNEEDGVVDVNGSEKLVIEPRATNSFYVKIEKR